MADFRKWIYALAFVVLLAGLTIPASAQISCNTNSGVPPTVRAEGYTELVGDLIMSCNGGVPTAAGFPVPSVNVQVFLTTNVTSRLLTTSGVIFDEALLIFDEPNSPVHPARPIYACGGSKAGGAASTAGAGDTSPNGPGQCAITSDGNPADTYDGTQGMVGTTGGTLFVGASAVCTTTTFGGTPATAYGCGRPNVFEGRPALSFANGGQNNSVIWLGVPFDPPGTTTTRTVRITNVRANAVGVGVSSTFTVSQIQMNISVSGNNSISINNPQQIVAFVQKGLNVTIARARTDFIQCNSENPDLYTVGVGGTPPTTFSEVPAFRGTKGSTCVSTSTQSAGSITSGCDREGYNMAGGYNANLNGIYPSGATANNTAGVTVIPSDATPTVRFIEGFPTAWKVKNISFLANASFSNAVASTYVYNGGTAYPADQNQNVPGANYNTESGFENPAGSGSDPAPNPPLGYVSGVNAGTPSLDNGSGFTTTNGLANAGVADHGTRLYMSFTNTPNGTQLWVPPIVYLYRQDKTLSNSGAAPNGDPTAFVTGFSTGVMVLTSTDSNGGGTFSALNSAVNFPAATNALVQVQNSLAVYEILYTDPFAYEQADVPVVVAYQSNLTQNLPQAGVNAQVTGGFAPFYTGASATAASTFHQTPDVPRFIPGSPAQTLFRISTCSCNLLFPFVASTLGFDTGIAVANASLDPGATFGFLGKAQQGTVQFWYYGNIPATGAPAPGPQTSSIVPAGQVLTYVLSSGSTQWGLDNRANGFEGYMIAQAGFQYCHAYAFISALGAGPTTNGTSEGYLGIVLDAPGLARTSNIGENDAH